MAFSCQQGNFEDAKHIREEVFMKEQGFQNEFEPLDADPRTIHVTGYNDDQVVACARIFPVPSSEDAEALGCPFLPSPEDAFTEGATIWVFGRLATLPEARGCGAGSRMLAASEAYAQENGADEIHLHAQCDKAGFYEKAGYSAYGAIEMDEHVPHQWMRKRLR